MGRTYGAIPSKPDPRDHRVVRYLAVAPETLPPSFQAPPVVPVYDQDGYGMCVTFTLAEVKEAQEAKERGTQTRYSAAFIYGNRGIFDAKGEGMSPRDALKQLKKVGRVPVVDVPDLRLRGAQLDHYDVAILVSHDGDFAPALNEVKQCGKLVEVAMLPRPRTNRLIEVADRVIRLDNEFMDRCWINGQTKPTA